MEEKSLKGWREKFISRLDSLSRLFLYILIFWLPYSPAVVESCVGTCLFLWIIKRGIYLSAQGSAVSLKQKFFLSLRFSPSSINLPIIVFLSISLISAFFSPLRERSVYGFFTKTFEWFIIYYLVTDVVRERKHVYTVIAVFLFTGFSTALDSIGQYFFLKKDIFSQQALVEGRATAAFHYANSLGAYLTVLVPLTVTLFIFQKKKISLSVFFCGICGILFLSLFITFSRGAWLASLCGIAISISCLKFKPLNWVSAGCAGALIILILVPNYLKYSSRINDGNFKTTVLFRMDTWDDTYKMIKERPFLGHGPNTYMQLFQKYRRKAQGRYEYEPTYAHNCYLQLLAEVGILGFLSFMWVLVRIFRNLIKYMEGVKVSGKDTDILIYVGLLGGAGAFLCHSFVDTNFYTVQLSIYLWYILGLLAAFGKMNNTDNISS